MNTLEKLKDYLEKEYRDLVRLITNPLPWWCDPQESKDKTITRGVGAVMFAQILGASYEEVEPIFDEFKKCIDDIIPTKEREVS